MMELMVSLLLSAALSLSAFTPFHPYKHPVMIWVPPYAVAKSEAQLESADVQKAITHLSLQFWVPTKAGDAVLTSSPEVTDAAVDRLRDWGHVHGIRVMLCIFNGADTWDWPLARAGFAANQDAFVKSLVAEMQRHKLDGIDIDLEGPANYEADKDAYVSFIGKLGKKLHAAHKQLTLDSFCYIWNAPNQGWWPDLFPRVDAISSMGYQDTGIAAKDWASYDSQVKAAGANAGKLQIGVPSDRDKWLGNTSTEQLDWIRMNGQTGIGIWDAQLPAASWRTAGVWQVIQKLRAGK